MTWADKNATIRIVFNKRKKEGEIKYSNIYPAKFIARPNRFIAEIEIDGEEALCHVKNTGRCRELLLPGADIYVQKADNKLRKTKYDLISVYKGKRLINIDSQIPNAVFHEWAADGNFLPDIQRIKPECQYKNSRFDFYMETEKEKLFAEVKGVTLEKDGAVFFPDAPTERGIKHILELCDCMENGYAAYLIFIVQMQGVRYFAPNRQTHPAFAGALCAAAQKGLHILAVDCCVTENEITADKAVQIWL